MWGFTSWLHHGFKIGLESLQLNIWPNHYRCRSDMMRCLQKNENFENRPKNRPNFFLNRFFHVLKSIWPFFWPVFILNINLKTKHLNWLATTRVCQYFHSWWMYKRFFKKIITKVHYEGIISTKNINVQIKSYF